MVDFFNSQLYIIFDMYRGLSASATGVVAHGTCTVPCVTARDTFVVCLFALPLPSRLVVRALSTLPSLQSGCLSSTFEALFFFWFAPSLLHACRCAAASVWLVLLTAAMCHVTLCCLSARRFATAVYSRASGHSRNGIPGRLSRCLWR